MAVVQMQNSRSTAVRLFRAVISPLEKAKRLMAEDAGVKRPRSLVQVAALAREYDRRQKEKGSPSD